MESDDDHEPLSQFPLPRVAVRNGVYNRRGRRDAARFTFPYAVDVFDAAFAGSARSIPFPQWCPARSDPAQVAAPSGVRDDQ